MDAVSDVSRGSQIFSRVPEREPLPSPLDVEELLGFTEAIRRRDFRRGLIEDLQDQRKLAKHKIFINHVDSFVGRQLVELFSRKPEEKLAEETVVQERPSREKTTAKSPKEKSPKKSKARSPKKAKEKADKSPKKEKSKSPAKSGKKSPKGKKADSLTKGGIDYEKFFNEVVKDDTLPYDTSKLTVAEYYELMELNTSEERNQYLIEKLGKCLEQNETDDQKTYSVKVPATILRKMVSNETFQIFGTLKNKDNMIEGVEIFSTSDENFINTLAECETIVYVINEDVDQVNEASWVLNALVKHLETQEECFSPVVILVSTFMTWALTKLLEHRPDLPLVEKDFRKRSPHPNYQLHYELEEQLVEMKFNGVLDSVIVVSGVPYGHEESILGYLFDMAFNCLDLPVFDHGNNVLPLVHVENLALIVKQLAAMKDFTESPFVFAKEPMPSSTMREIVEAISKNLGTGCVRKMSKLFSFLKDEITQDVYDQVNTNLVLESCYPLFKEEDIKWRYASGFVANIKHIAEEFVASKQFLPLRVAFYYSRKQFKEVAKRLSEHYTVPLVTPEDILKQYVGEALDVLKPVEKLEPSLNLVDQPDEIKECSDEIRKGLVNLIKELKIEQLKDVKKLSKVDKMRILDEIMNSSLCMNRGYVLDNFPRSLKEAKVLFKTEDLQELAASLPNVVIWLNKRVSSFSSGQASSISKPSTAEASSGSQIYKSFEDDTDSSSSEIDEGSIQEESERGDVVSDKEVEMEYVKFLNKIKRKRRRKSIRLPTKVVDFILENNTECRMVEVEVKNVSNDEDILQDVVLAINSPSKKESETLTTEQSEKQEHAVSFLEEKASQTVVDEFKSSIKTDDFTTKQEEESILALRGVPYVKYLIKYIFPTLTNAILQVAESRPDDPLDYIAEYLFKNNPDGRMIDPAEEIRRLELLNERKGIVKIDSKACLA